MSVSPVPATACSGSARMRQAGLESQRTRSSPDFSRSSDSPGCTPRRSCVRQSPEAWIPVYSRTRPDDRSWGDRGCYRLDWTRIAFERSVSDDEIDLDSGFLIVPTALPEKPAAKTSPPDSAPTDDKRNIGETGGESEVRKRSMPAGSRSRPLTLRAISPSRSSPTGMRASTPGMPSPIWPILPETSPLAPKPHPRTGSTRTSWRTVSWSHCRNWD